MSCIYKIYVDFYKLDEKLEEIIISKNIDFYISSTTYSTVYFVQQKDSNEINLIDGK